MLWEYVYIGSDVLRNALIGLCLIWPTRGETSAILQHQGTRLPSNQKRKGRTPKARMGKHKQRKPSPHAQETSTLGTLLALEPRIMFDGAAFVTGAEILNDQTTQDPLTENQDLQGLDAEAETSSDPLTGNIDLFTALSTITTPSDRKEMVFINTDVADYQTLLLGIDPHAETILLDSTRDGMEQIAKILGERSGIDAIHIISHGNQGELRLGTGLLNLASMVGEYADELATINHALTNDADFLIYGCNFGEGAIGRESATLLAQLTGADVAASDDLTGHTALGGDWHLEVQTGTIESSVIVSTQSQEEWQSLLPNLTSTGEFVVHTASGNDEDTDGLVRGAERAVDIAPSGNYVVVWSNSTSSNEIFATVFDKDGNPVVAEFQVNTGGGNHSWADVAMDDTGNFVVAWTQGNDVLMRRFLADGTPVDGADVQVNTLTANIQRNASIHMNGAGDFVIAWEGDGTGSEGIFVRQGSMGGGLTGSDITVNTATAAQDPSVAIADSGDFVVVWDDGFGDVFYQLFNNAGIPQAGSQVDVAFQFSAGGAAVDMAGDGRFAIAYQASGVGLGVYVRQFDAAGSPVALPQLVNTTTTGNQSHPSLSMNDAGDFIVVWEGNGDQGLDIDANGVFGQKFDATGTKVGIEFLVNDTKTNSQDRASVAILDTDNFVVVWTGSDGAQTDVFAKQYGATLPPTVDLDSNDSSGAIGNGFAVTFTEGDPATAIADTDTNVADADSTTFAFVTLSISGLLDGNAETLVLDGDSFALATDVISQDTSGGNYTVHITTSAGSAHVTITKQGGGTLSEVETEMLIEAIRYQHTDTNAPTDGNRLIDVTVNDGTTDSTTARSTINVNPVNDPPTGIDDAFTVAEGSTTILNLAGNDTDPDDALNLSSILIISGPSNGTITSINTDGTVTYTHNGSETLSDSFTYTINDQTGDTSNTVTVNLTITPVNDPPVAVTDNFTIAEGSANTFNLAGNDTDPDNALDLASIAIVTGPANGTITSINTDGTVNYTHNGSETLSDSFTYTIRDVSGAISNTATVNLTVTPQNDAPVITSDGGGGTAGVSIIEGATLATDIDAFDAEGATLTYSIIGGADAGLFTIDSNSGVLSFLNAPTVDTPGDVGGDNIYNVTVQVSDGTLIDTQSLAVTVTTAPVIVLPPPPDPTPEPSPSPDDGDTDEDTPLIGINIVSPSPGFSSRTQQDIATERSQSDDSSKKSHEMDLAALQGRNGGKGFGSSMSDLFGDWGQPLGLSTFKSEIQSLLNPSSGFLKDLDDARDGLHNLVTTEKTFLASSVAATTGLSIGYVIWLLRSGVLLTALLSSVPAWQFVNPLVVLSSPAKRTRKKGEEDVAEDSLESMFDQQSQDSDFSETSTGSPSKTRRSRWFRRTHS